jgi:phage tail-like protein
LGDSTRRTYRPGKRYRRVPLQQGRVRLDADWDEQDTVGLVELLAYVGDQLSRYQDAIANEAFLGPADSGRVDPYKNFKFLLTFEGGTTPAAAFDRMSTLRRTAQVVSLRQGGDSGISHKSPGRTEYDAMTLERGVTHDADFENWADAAWNSRGSTGSGTSPADLRKNIAIDLRNVAGRVVRSYRVYRCWVSEWQEWADPRAGPRDVLIRRIRIQNEGWERAQPPPSPK